MIKASKIFFLCALITALVGCTRGETKTLDEVLKTAKQDFKDAGDRGLSSETSSQLKDLTAALDQLVGGAEVGQAELDKVVSDLIAIVPSSGYTSRPAFTEIINQYQNLDVSGEKSAKGAVIKLLVARTYTLLASELNGARFGLKEWELKQ